MRVFAVTARGKAGWIDAPTPTAGPGEVRLKMRLAGFNHRDVWHVAGMGDPPLPAPLLSDGVGAVDQVGEGADPAWVGKTVILNPSIGCGTCQACLRGDEPACERFRILTGTAAEWVVVPERQIVEKPLSLSEPEAAVVALVAITAYDMVVERASVCPGDRVLVWGANGGLGSMAMEMVRMRGGLPVAVGSDREYLAGLGAAEIVDRHRPGFEDELRKLGPFDAVLDSVGATVPLSMALLRRGGALVTVGATANREVRLSMRDIYTRRLAIHGTFMGATSILPRVMPLFAEGALRPPHVEVLPPEGAEGALTSLEEGGLKGKLALSLES